MRGNCSEVLANFCLSGVYLLVLTCSKLKLRTGPTLGEMWLVSSRTSQNVTIKETPVLKQFATETTSAKGVTVQFPLYLSFCVWSKNICQSGVEGGTLGEE